MSNIKKRGPAADEPADDIGLYTVDWVSHIDVPLMYGIWATNHKINPL